MCSGAKGEGEAGKDVRRGEVKEKVRWPRGGDSVLQN